MTGDPPSAPAAAGLSASKQKLIAQRLRRRSGAPRPPSEPTPRTVPAEPWLVSPAQRWMYLAHESDAGSPGFNMTSSFLVAGTLDTAAFERCVARVAERHDVLRINFSRRGSDVEAALHADRTFPLERICCEDTGAMMARAETLASLPFDLGADALLRLYFLEAPSGDALLLLVVSDIIADRWSLGIFWREVAALYSEETGGMPAALPPIAAGAHDVARWQREWLTPERSQGQVQYWQERLSNLPHPIALPTDRPYPLRLTGSGRLEVGRVSADVARAVRDFAASENASVFMLLLAGFQAMLHRYTGSTDVIVGSPVANRRRKEMAALIGFFLSTVPLRSAFQDGTTTRQLLHEVRTSVLQAIEHQDVPFDRIVEAVKPRRVPGRHPVCQVMLVHQTQAEAPRNITLGTATLRHTYVETRSSKFDLTIFVAETGDGMETVIEYRTDLFDSDSVRRMLGHYARLLESMSNEPDRPIAELEMLTAGERARLLHEWQGVPVPPGNAASVIAQIRARAARAPDAVAAAGTGASLTYAQLDARSEQVALELRQRGLQRGQPVALFASRTPDAMAGLLGILKAGGAYVPIDPEYPADRHRLIVRDAGIDTAVTTPGLEPRAASLAAHVVVTADATLEPAQAKAGAQAIEIEGRQPAYVIYTSGSSGTPKGVVVSHGNLLHSNEARLHYYGGAPRCFLLLPSFSFDSSIAGIFWTLTGGGTLVIASAEEQRDPARLRAIVRAHGVSDLLCIPALYREILAGDASDLGSLQRVIVAGEACTPELVRLHHERLPHTALFNEYGPTEVSVWATVHECRPEDGSEGMKVPIGRPIPNTAAYVLDDHRQLLPAGIPGELFLGGDGVAQGYFGREELTRERFVHCTLPGLGGARLYRTGDLVRWRHDGALEFLGRTDGQFKLRGYRIEAGEIEHALEDHPSVRRAVVVAAGNQIAAYIVAAPGKGPIPTAVLRESLQARMPAFMVPSVIVPVDALPLLPNGKVDRAALASRAIVRDERPPAEAAANPVEAQLMRIWDDLIDVQQIGRHDNFFELGGHSLLLPRLIDRVHRDFGVALPLGIIFEAPTVKGLAEVIQSRTSIRSWRSLVGIRERGRRTPLYMVHGLGGEIGMFYNLAEHLHPEQPLYGLQAPAEPFSDLQRMAAYYLEEIRAHQPRGPYLLGGYCLGGCVAYEMACQLVDAGESVPLLAIIDAIRPGSRPAPRTLRQRVSGALSKTPSELVAAAKQRAARAKGWMTTRLGAKEEVPAWYRVPRAFHDIATRHYRAVLGYVPRPYRGDAWLFRSQDTRFERDLGWGRLVEGRLSIEMVPGRHSDVLKEPNLRETARQIAAAVDAAQPEP